MIDGAENFLDDMVSNPKSISKQDLVKMMKNPVVDSNFPYFCQIESQHQPVLATQQKIVTSIFIETLNKPEMRKDLLEQAETLDRTNQINFVNTLYTTSQGLNTKEEKKAEKAPARAARMEVADGRERGYG